MRGLLSTLRAVVPVAVVLLLVGGAILSVRGDDDTTMVSADFKDPSPLMAGNDVRLNGVRVGTIDTMKVVDGGARLTLELEATALPIYQDAKLSSRPVSLLGERYLDLDPGTAEAGELKAGAVLPQTQTGSATDLDEVLNVLDKPTSQSLAALVTTLGVGLGGNGEDVRDAIKALEPAMRDTTQLTSVLKDQNEVLGRLVDSFEPVASGLAADEGKALDQLVGSAEQMLTSTADNEAAFRAMLKKLPGTLQSAQRTLTTLTGTAEDATPTVVALQPTTKNLEKLSRELKDFADSANPALKSANPVLEKAEKLMEEARPVAEQLRQHGEDLTSVSESLDPLTKKLGGEFTTVMEFFKGWALATNGRDGLAHYFRAGTVVTPYSATGQIPSLDGTRPGSLFDPDADEAGAGDPAPNTDASKNATAGLLAPSTGKDGGVTGMDTKQERGLLGMLLGGL